MYYTLNSCSEILPGRVFQCGIVGVVEEQWDLREDSG